MKKKLIRLAILVGGLLAVVFISNSIDGIMHELLQEIYDKITNLSLEKIKQQFSGDAIAFEGYGWSLGFIIMWFVFQWIMLTRCHHIVLKVIPLVITVALWILAEFLNIRLSSGDFTAYALCYVTLHWMIGSWLCCFLGNIMSQKDPY